MKREIIIPKYQGFCVGVKKALDKVNEYQKAYILGELIHNRQVVNQLESQGKIIIRRVTGKEKHPIVITAHGTTKEKLRKLKELGLEIVDTTCPLVSMIYKTGIELESEGRHILIVGDKEHVEVQGIVSYMTNPIIVREEKDIEKLQLPSRIGIICQSTFKEVEFDKIVQKVQEVITDVKVEKTICNPTIKRQKATEELAQNVDLMIVIGGYHSSNTRKLAELSEQYVTTLHIETEMDLTPELLENKRIIGIVAGTSTPHWLIDKVKKAIDSF